MGRSIATLVSADSRFALVAGVCRRPPGPEFCDLQRALKFAEKSDIVVDFSLPAGSLALARIAARARIGFVTGTTGFSPAQLRELKRLSSRIPLLASPNMSPGMNLLFALARKAAAALPGYDAGVFEIHHTLKKDAPSGSAVRLAAAVAEGRRRGPVPAESLRLGRVVGEHTVHFAGPDERLELTHRAEDRAVFARGALEAALWLHRRGKKGLYSMMDVLGL